MFRNEAPFLLSLLLVGKPRHGSQRFCSAGLWDALQSSFSPSSPIVWKPAILLSRALMLCRALSVPACPQPGTALSSISTESCRTAVKQRSAGEQNAPKSQFRAFLYGHRLSPCQRLPAEVRAREAVSDWRLPSASSVLQVSFAAN